MWLGGLLVRPILGLWFYVISVLVKLGRILVALVRPWLQFVLHLMVRLVNWWGIIVWWCIWIGVLRNSIVKLRLRILESVRIWAARVHHLWLMILRKLLPLIGLICLKLSRHHGTLKKILSRLTPLHNLLNVTHVWIAFVALVHDLGTRGWAGLGALSHEWLNYDYRLDVRFRCEA